MLNACVLHLDGLSCISNRNNGKLPSLIRNINVIYILSNIDVGSCFHSSSTYRNLKCQISVHMYAEQI